MDNIRFGIDLDGVLCDFTSEVVNAANRLWPNKMPLGYKPDKWDYQEILTSEEWKRVWSEIINTENLWLKEKELLGVPALQRFLWKHSMAEVYFVTARAETKGMSVLVQSTEWLEKRGLWSRFNRSTVIPVEHAPDKIKVLEDLKLPFFLDDHAPTIAALQSISGLNSYVLDESHNRYAAHLPRVSNVEEYLKIVEQYENN